MAVDHHIHPGSNMTADDFIVFGAPHIEQAEIDAVVEVLESRWLGTGPRVTQFENAFGIYKGAANVAAVSSCTAALHLSLLAAGIGPGDEVITTPLTFCATINAILHTGATPVLADVDSRTMNIDPSEIERRITPRTRAILPVHFAGRACDMNALCDITSRHELVLIEDCAHAIETEYKGRKAGTFGDFGCFSFYATKNVTCGEGGMVITRRSEDMARVKMLALHGMTKDAWKRFSDEGYKHYQVVECGYKYNMMDLQAAIGIHQLRRVNNGWNRREKLWSSYQAAFRDSSLTLPAHVEADTRHAYHLYTVLVDSDVCGISRDSFLQRMTSLGIGVGVHYLSVAEHPYYHDRLGWNVEQWPNAMRIGRQTVSLPLSPSISDEDANRVVEAVSSTLADPRRYA
jgi:dTDP-4-amino-4,6-dideoxygalactose transaminase